MKVIGSIAEMKRIRSELDGTIGLFPTLGFLHEAHLNLVRRSRAENDLTICSLFVNPAQFAPDEDFNNYPKDYQQDANILENEKVDYLFLPEINEMYPEGYDTWVEVHGIANMLEGARRPDHFRGVTTVLTKIFNILKPNKAYFGQKDFQQCLVVKKLVSDLNLGVKVVICPTVREPDGLAMSSRNVYLNSQERTQADVLFQSLELAKKIWLEGENSADVIRNKMTELILQKPLAEIEYISIADTQTLEELEHVQSSMIISMAVRFGKTRLLDNILFE